MTSCASTPYTSPNPNAGAGMPGNGAAASAAAANPYVQAVPPMAVKTSPGLAFLLGLIPGVGAIYNGQYLKGLVHAAIFGLLVTVISSSGGGESPFIAMLIMGLEFYMPFEAYHTAKKRQAGIVVDEWSSLVPLGMRGGRVPVGPVILIGLGVLFLLDSLHVLEFREIGRFWPVLLIVTGAYMLYSRVTRPVVAAPPPAYQQAAPAYQAPPVYQAPPAYQAPGAPGPDDVSGARHE